MQPASPKQASGTRRADQCAAARPTVRMSLNRAARLGLEVGQFERAGLAPGAFGTDRHHRSAADADRVFERFAVQLHLAIIDVGEFERRAVSQFAETEHRPERHQIEPGMAVEAL